MALKQLLIANRISALRSQLELQEAAKQAIELRRTALAKREAELETALGEVTKDTSAEDRAVLDQQTEQWQQEDTALTGEEAENTSARADLEKQISALQSELDAMNARGKAPSSEDTQAAGSNAVRKDVAPMNNKRTLFFGMTLQERDAFLARDEVKTFLARVCALAKEKRAVSGADLTIPEVMLDVVRENISEYSKLLSKVRNVSVGGKARENIMGAIPEAVWMEMISNFNELEFQLYDIEVDGFAVGGFLPLPNALMKDSRYPALAAEIIRMLGAAIGLALDKAILYGTGVKMPLGIVTRLNQTVKPSDYPATRRPWADLHSSNILAVRGGSEGSYTALDGISLFKGIAAASGAARGKYSTGTKFWAMNETTWQTLVVAAMSVNAAGAIVSGASKVMPVIGGEVVTLDFMPNGEIVGGYGDCYLLAEREGMALNSSEHVRFLARQTVFAGEARYDGMPVIPEAFVAMAIDGGTVTTSMSFALDNANPEGANLSALTVGSLTLTPSFSPSVVNYEASTANASAKLSSAALNDKKGAVVVQKNGNTVIEQGGTATLSTGENVLTFEVTYGTTSRTYKVTVNKTA